LKGLDEGGGVYINANAIEMESCTFLNNTSEGDGGAISIFLLFSLFFSQN